MIIEKGLLLYKINVLSFVDLLNIIYSLKMKDDKMKHKLKIVSLSDAQLDCKCGWHIVRTGTMTRREAIKEYKKHLDYHNRIITRTC